MISFNVSSLHFQASPLVLALAILGLLAGAALCFTAWRRALRPKRTGALELLRFLIILLVALLLLRPEWRTTSDSDLQPEIAILWDDSKSMSTEDARVPALFSPDQLVTSRAELLHQILSTEFWKPFEENDKNRVRLTPFATPDENLSPEQAALTGTDLDTALTDALEASQNLRAVILLSDGDWNLGSSPVSAAQKLSLRDIPLYTLPLGSEQRLPDLSLESVTAPTYGIVGENVQIPFTIHSSLPQDTRTIIRLRSESGQERSKQITIPANTSYHDSILWRIEKEGSSELNLSFPVARGELLSTNNNQEFSLSGRPESIRALVIETLPRWEYRFIRNALSRDPGVQVDCLLLHPQIGPGDGPDYIAKFPETPEELQKYDVIFLGDIGIGPDQLTAEQTTLLKGLVENQASGIVFIPGPQGHTFSLLGHPLAELLPVTLDPKEKNGLTELTPSPLELTEEGRGSLLTMLGDSEEDNPLIWKSLPGFYWSAPVLKAKSGSEVLAVHANRRNENGRIPLITTSRAGTGKVLFMGIDAAWRWRRGVEDLYHYRFWGQVARWMSYQRNMAAGQKIRLHYTPERPKPGDTLTLNANAFDANGAPLQDGALLLNITPPGGTPQRLELQKDNATWGSFLGTFKITKPGTWKLEAQNPDDPDSTISATLIAQGTELEKTGQPARPDTLAELSRITKAKHLTPAQLEDLVAEINTLPQPRPVIDTLPLWSHWLTALTLTLLLSLFWIGRKLNGTF
ncbi:MAG: hypothetical protein ACQKBY_02760 [Verrucomicrobiales bacterium]